MNAGIIFKITGILLLVPGGMAIVSLLLAQAEGETIAPWLWCTGVYLCCGMTGLLLGRRTDAKRDLGIGEGIAVTTLFWLSASMIGGIAIWLNVPHCTYMQAWFECMSGLTTTGSTIFGSHTVNGQEQGVLIAALPNSILFWRSALQWMGGIGIVVIFIALIPLLLGGSGFQLYRAEIPGMSTDRLSPRLSTTTRILVGFYLTATLVLIVALLLCGTRFFDALCHAMTCISTGGFSTYDNSIEGLDSHAAEWVIIVGMLFAGINFSLLIQFLRGKPLILWQSSETKAFLSLVIIAWAMVCISLALQSDIYDNNKSDLIRDSLFQVVSLSTSTGYGTGYSSHPLSWDAWPPVAIIILLLLMFCGGCAGSTAGGMKMARVLVLIKTMRREIRRYAEPQRVTPMVMDGKKLNDRTIMQVNAFAIIYGFTLALGCIGFTLLGHSPSIAFSASLTALSNIGPGLSDIGASGNFRAFDDVSLGLSILLMLLGRLELMTVLVTLNPGSWRK